MNAQQYATMVAVAQQPVRSSPNPAASASSRRRSRFIPLAAVLSSLASLALLTSWTSATAADSCDPSQQPITVTIHPNGGVGGGIGETEADDADAGGEILTLPRDELVRRIGNLYNASGLRHDLDEIANNTVLYRPPTRKGTHFVYPSLPVGTRITLPDITSPSTGNPIELEVLSPHSPRVFYVHDFMSAEETDKLIEFLMDESNPYKMARSTFKSWSQEGGREAITPGRTSMNAYDLYSQTSMDIKRRAFKLLRIPRFEERMADGIQVLRYETSQAYVAHHDYLHQGQGHSADFNFDPAEGGSNRFATVFLYLSDVEVGGQTCFPLAERLRLPPNATDYHDGGDTGGEEGVSIEALTDLIRRLKMSEPPPSEETLSDMLDEAGIAPGSWEDKLTRDCHRKFSVPPRRGDAVLFYVQTPDGRLDPTSLHGACPVLRGTKWGANVWVWNACRVGMCRGDGMTPSEEQDFQY